jgi:hypothetical protein
MALLAMGPTSARSAETSDGTAPLRLFADLSDADDDGVADAAATMLSSKHRARIQRLSSVPEAARRLSVRSIEGDSVRLIAGSRPVRLEARTKPWPLRELALQGVAAGAARVVFSDGSALAVNVVELMALDPAGERVDLATSHASLARTLPPSLLAPGRDEETDALRWLAVGPPAALPASIGIVSTRPDGSSLDRLERVPLVDTQCQEGIAPELACRLSPAVRATVDDIDRSHPATSARSLRGEVGGRLTVLVGDVEAASIRVGGPRQSRFGAIGRYRARVELRVVRLFAGGAAAVGGDDAGALEIARRELRTASDIWGQCGLHMPDDAIEVVDPPPPHLLAIGCTLGLPASGGTIAFSAGSKAFRLPTLPGQSPERVAAGVARALREAGFEAIISPNPRIDSGALRTVDVLVRRANGALQALAPLPDEPISSDKTLGVCLGEVDLSDGLSHFTDIDAVAGTLEERTLIKAFPPGRPGTIQAFLVPAFTQSSRIGESFIRTDGSSIQNVVILDRAGVRSGARSYALAHEIGHILLDMPGHPDDYGVDQPWSLMDADASDPTIFGPRRLSVSECERAILQSGPGAAVPLLEAWPLYQKR